MPLDEYASAVGGGLKLKGAKVGKPKKKKRREKSDLEKNLETGDEGGASGALVKHRDEAAGGDDDNNRKKKNSKKDGVSQDLEAEAEAGADEDRDDNDDGRVVRKTEAERRYEERKRKRLLELAESSSSRPELLKTHKERVEELNTYLSKLSEHHDMPKIGPG
ncbi:uncharacterized protein LY79DRAFT_535262 [Colletotrichum navitas]|uniref:DUF1754-domain-containing protein n=1 Tax=Colletotrichum navitas TaxID=681940 RepID=A0AAD8QCI0_9PEZI|nr:uncharacterized protein LY79DRAFT_535262 [Colletotrichum navitas]KAK1599501.1 hypothetical protein LY79DRAFT_535262 [Colletotrichum navitas]